MASERNISNSLGFTQEEVQQVLRAYRTFDRTMFLDPNVRDHILKVQRIVFHENVSASSSEIRLWFHALWFEWTEFVFS